MTIDRRTLLSGAGVLGLSALGAPSASAHLASSEAAGRGRSLQPGDTAYIDVTAATLWCDATIDGVEKLAWDVPRPGIDDASLTNPVDLRAWNANMVDTETRAWLSGNFVLETQGVMGTRVILTERHEAWAKVIVPLQATPRADGNVGGVNGYPGWMPAVQLAGADDFGAAMGSASLATVTSRYAWLSHDPRGRSRTTELAFDTVLPVVDRRLGGVRVLRPNGSREWLREADVAVRATGELPPRPSGADIVATARGLLGIRYLWAGVSSFGYDCSGFTYTCYRHHGLLLNRDAEPQRTNSGGQVIESGELTPDASVDREAWNVGQWQAADLAFFGSLRESTGLLRASHVGMVAEPDAVDPLIIHSPSSDTTVKEQRLSELLAGGRQVVGIRRYL